MTATTIRNKRRPAKIMVVEDNRGDVVLLMRAFRDIHMESHVVSVENAEQALEILRGDGVAEADRPDLILLDLNLTKMNGHDFLGIIKSDMRLRCIPVVVLSSSRAEQDVIRSYDLHANGYIVKPIDLEKFRDLVAAIEGFFFNLVAVPDAADCKQHV